MDKTEQIELFLNRANRTISERVSAISERVSAEDITLYCVNDIIN